MIFGVSLPATATGGGGNNDGGGNGGCNGGGCGGGRKLVRDQNCQITVACTRRNERRVRDALRDTLFVSKHGDGPVSAPRAAQLARLATLCLLSICPRTIMPITMRRLNYGAA